MNRCLWKHEGDAKDNFDWGLFTWKEGAPAKLVAHEVPGVVVLPWLLK